MPPSRLERAIEAALTLGVVSSGVLLLVGLTLASPHWLRAGVLLLMLTPVARVVVVAVGLILERDWPFAVVSLWILGLLATSLWIALGS